MPNLEDDIARIAAMRGRPVESVLLAERQRRLISCDDVARLFGPLPESASEFAAMERLSADARSVIREAPETMSACRYHTLVPRHGEAATLGAIRQFMPQIIAAYAKVNYGSTHPQARAV